MLPISSREYKVMLRKAAFRGDRNQVSETALDFWKCFKDSVEDLGLGVFGKLDRWKEDRIIRFFDTDGQSLIDGFFVLRERRNFATGEDRSLTLKFRCPDRFVSQGAEVLAADEWEDDAKFEEDLKLPFRSLYSRSNKLSIPAGAAWPDLGTLAGFFPGIRDSLPGFTEEARLSLVNDREHRELVVKGGKIQLGEDPDVESSCALILWYAADDASLVKPEAVEFSFNHDVPEENGLESLGADPARRAYEVFKQLGAHSGPLAGWVDPEGSTKTELVYA